MRQAIFGVLLVGILAGVSGVRAQDSGALRAVISEQFQAFEAGDAAAAYGLASPTIQQLFGDAGNFGAMVKNRYPMIWDPQEVTFLGLGEVGGKLMQRVQVTAGGALFFFDYEMVEIDGVWRINGVWPVKGESLGV